MSNAKLHPKRASAIAALASVFNTQRHLALAIPHNLAAELESEQMAEAYRSGKFPPPSWLDEASTRALLDLKQLRRTLLNTSLIAVALAVIAAAIGAGAGKVHPALPLDYGKVTTSFAGTFAAWAALLQLSPVRRTFRGSMIHETVYALAVRLFAVAGIILAAVGALWWQSGLTPRCTRKGARIGRRGQTSYSPRTRSAALSLRTSCCRSRISAAASSPTPKSRCNRLASSACCRSAL